MIKAVTGTKDILPPDIPRWKYLEKIVERVFSSFNYKEIRTPVFEETALFARGIGEETDIVGKEMYTFKDRSDTSLTLKPEMTAAVVRAYVEHSLGAQQPLVKLFYMSPMFRQERPQAGRFRQFHQFGAEAIGSQSPLLDAEMIQMAYFILTQLGLKDIVVKINSLGVTEDREVFRKVIREYLKDKIQTLSEESQRRYKTNILRIFDSKLEVDKAIMELAPKMTQYLSDESKRNFDVVKSHLTNIGIPFEIDHTLFRGLDYYTETTFEIVSGSVGAQTALVGGGRYDLLIETLGGKPTPATGFAAGIERILLACENEKSLVIPESLIDVYLIRIDNELEAFLSELAGKLRKENLSVDFDYLQRSVKAQMREANKLNAKYVLFIGGDEYKEGLMNLKNMSTGAEEKINFDKVDTVISKLRS
jgi:histidyl-tRNA synthetase